MKDNGPIAIPVKLAGNTAIAVGVGATVYTDVITLYDLDTFALSYKAVCTGVPNVKIQMEQAIVAPATEGAADVNYVVPEGIADIEAALTDQYIHHRAIFPVCLTYIRLKITEVTGTVTDTVLTINLVVQRKGLM
jgi:hypothetical protein